MLPVSRKVSFVFLAPFIISCIPTFLIILYSDRIPLSKRVFVDNIINIFLEYPLLGYLIIQPIIILSLNLIALSIYATRSK